MKKIIVIFLFAASIGAQGCSIIKKDCNCPRFNQIEEAPAIKGAEQV